MVEWLVASLKEFDWQVEVQELEYAGQKIRNVVAKQGSQGDWLILGAHYDTRIYADRDPDPNKQKDPVMGANDGASGVAVLLELARVLPDELDKQIWLVFFDAEDNGHIPGWDWILGSRAFVENLDSQPQAAIIVDMVGDADLELYYEQNSDEELSNQLWQQAKDLGYGEFFIPEVKYAMLDDHTPFLQAGIPAIDIIDFDYPYWHTTSDTLDKVSAASLDAVGDTLLQWILTE
jgi:Zn-dependent M28 family amino/carboxypeptidase